MTEKKKSKTLKPAIKSTKKRTVKLVEPKESKKADGIYSIDASKDKIVTRIKTIYTILGQQDKLVDKLPVLERLNVEKSHLAYARKESNGDKNSYFIKVDNFGHLYNPMAIDTAINMKTKLLKDELSKFIKVSELCFNHYLEFLKSKNILHFKFASRER